MNKLFWKVRLVVMAVNLTIAGIFAYFGWLLDQRHGTGVAYTFAGVIVSFPIAQLIVYRMVKKLV